MTRLGTLFLPACSHRAGAQTLTPVSPAIEPCLSLAGVVAFDRARSPLGRPSFPVCCRACHSAVSPLRTLTRRRTRVRRADEAKVESFGHLTPEPLLA
jgi:hypothetical protein